MAISPWRLNLKPASLGGAQFHVDVDARNSGRRIALHEFPKKDIPYAEDMGRKAKRFTINAYVIGPDYEDQRDAIIAVLEAEGPNQLIHPTFTQFDMVAVETYSVTERRERGGYAEFEITCVEAGKDVSSQLANNIDSQSGVSNAADTAVPKASSSFGNDFSGSSDITALA